MKTMIRKRTAILCLILALLCAVSCTPGNGDAETTSAQTEDETLPLPSDDLLLAEPSGTVYKLIRPEGKDEGYIECYRTIARGFEQEADYTYTGSDDWVKPGEDRSADKELLIGFTNRPESREVLESIGYDDFAIRVVGNKVVVAAHTRSRLQEAVEYFRDHLIRYENGSDGTRIYLTGEYHFQGTFEPFFGPKNPLSSYVLVRQDGNSAAEKNALEIRTKIKKIYGVELPIITDSEAQTPFEIVLGSVRRPIAKKHLEGLQGGNYVLAAEGTTLYVGAATDAHTQMALTLFAEKYLSPYSYTFNLQKEFFMEESVYQYQEMSALAEGADIRVMSFNLLCELWDDKVPVEGRDVSAVAAIRYFSPDVIGIQEVSDVWHKRFGALFTGDYVIPYPKTEREQTNFSTLAYNTEKVKMIAGGTKVFSGGNDPRLRLATWALFEMKATSKRFVVMTTHWDLGKNPQFQQIHSDEMAALALMLGERYQVPVITTGDYNVNEASPYYANFLQKTGYSDAKFSAAVINRACQTTHKIGTTPSSKAANAIDHIFGSPQVQFLYFNVLLDQSVIETSDHCPIYADIKLP